MAFHCSRYCAVVLFWKKKKRGWWEADLRVLIDRPGDLIQTKASNVERAEWLL